MNLNLKPFPLKTLVAQMRRKKAVAFSRFGDGEWLAILGASGGNCDGHSYFPEMGEALAAVVRKKPGYRLGMNPCIEYVSWVSDERREQIAAFLAQIRMTTADFYDADIFQAANWRGELRPLVDLIRKKRSLFVAPRALLPAIRRFFPNASSVEILEKNCWLEIDRIERTLRAAIHSRCAEMVLFSAGMPANVLIDRLFDEFGAKVSLLDVGSIWDAYSERLNDKGEPLRWHFVNGRELADGTKTDWALAAAINFDLPILAVKTYNRPEILRRCVENLIETTEGSDCCIQVYDDGSTDPAQREYLRALNHPKVSVKCWPENGGGNVNTQRFLDFFLKNKISNFILLDDDVFFFRKNWLPDVLAAMQKTPHRFVRPENDNPKRPTPHGFFLTGTYELLKKVGPYDLKTFDKGYGDAHADWSFRCDRLGLAAEYEPPIDREKILTVKAANPQRVDAFWKDAKRQDAVMYSERKSLPWEKTTIAPRREGPLDETDYFIGVKTCVLAGRDDREAFFQTTMQTLLATTSAPIFIFDDGSTHPAHQASLAAMEKQARIFVRRLERGGIAKTQNAILREFWQSDRRAVALLDDDVEFQSGWLRPIAEMQNVGPEYSYVAAKVPEVKFPGGYVIAMTRECVNAIGGFCETLAPYGQEHEEHLLRCIKLGFALRWPGSGFEFRGRHLAWKQFADEDGVREREKNRRQYDVQYTARQKNGPWHLPLEPEGVTLSLASYHRPFHLAVQVRLMRETTSQVLFDKILVYSDERDLDMVRLIEGDDCFDDWRLLYEPAGSSVKASERGIMFARTPLVIWLNDDAWFYDGDRWLEKAQAIYREKFGGLSANGVMGFADVNFSDSRLHSEGRWAAFGMMHKEVYLNVIRSYPTPFLRYAWDNEVRDRANDLGLFHFAEDLKILHTTERIEFPAVQAVDQVVGKRREKEWAAYLGRKAKPETYSVWTPAPNAKADSAPAPTPPSAVPQPVQSEPPPPPAPPTATSDARLIIICPQPLLRDCKRKYNGGVIIQDVPENPSKLGVDKAIGDLLARLREAPAAGLEAFGEIDPRILEPFLDRMAAVTPR